MSSWRRSRHIASPLFGGCATGAIARTATEREERRPDAGRRHGACDHAAAHHCFSAAAGLSVATLAAILVVVAFTHVRMAHVRIRVPRSEDVAVLLPRSCSPCWST